MTTPEQRFAIPPLTPQQTVIAKFVAEGWSNQGIADALVLARGTVANHVEQILMRLNLRNRAAIAAWYVRRTAPLVISAQRWHRHHDVRCVGCGIVVWPTATCASVGSADACVILTAAQCPMCLAAKRRSEEPEGLLLTYARGDPESNPRGSASDSGV